MSTPSEMLREVYRAALPDGFRRSIGLSRQARSPKPLFHYLSAHLRDDRVRNMKQRLRSLHREYEGQRCFIMGSGPSLNKMDLEVFRNEYVWGLNKCYLLFDRVSWRPSFYVAVDTRVVPDIASQINRMSKDLPQTKFFFPVRFRERGVLRSYENVYWYRQVRMDESNLPYGTFTRDASEWVSSVRTVTIAAMQLAVYLGFDPIYLIGCDTSYSVPSSVRLEEGDKDKFVSTEDDDSSHFDPRYFGKGSKWHRPRTDRMIFHYKQARQVCEHLDVSVYNATVGGKLEVFPRVEYMDLFK